MAVVPSTKRRTRQVSLGSLYLDTNALNALRLDPARERLTELLVGADATVYLSELNVTEMAARSDADDRRESLLLGRRLALGRRPLADPRVLLERSLDAFANGRKEMDATADDARNDYYVALSDPGLITEEVRQRAYDLNQKEETWYREAHENARESMQAEVTRLGAGRPRTADQLRRLYFSRPDFLSALFEPFLRAYGHPELAGREQEILLRVEHWKFFFSAMGAGVFHRAIKPTGYGWKRNAGAVDTQQAIYLACADVFVTNDLPLRRVMKPIAKMANKQRRVMSFPEMKGALLAGTAAPD
jgi:hypothetical protein